MDDYSSADLDLDPASKTPLYLGISAAILGLAGLALGWVGFSKAGEAEARLGELEGAAVSLANLESRVGDAARRHERLEESVNTLSREISRALKQVEDDVGSIKTEVRRVTIQAGTALRKVESVEKEIENAQPRIAASPPPERAPAPERAPSPTQNQKDSAREASVEGSAYRIQSGDTFARLAARHNLTLDALLNANPGVDPRRLLVGQEVFIPNGD